MPNLNRLLRILNDLGLNGRTDLFFRHCGGSRQLPDIRIHSTLGPPCNHHPERTRVRTYRPPSCAIFIYEDKNFDENNQQTARFLSAYINKDKVNVTTHTSLAGGSYHVTRDGYREDFLAKYLHGFRSNETLFLTERVIKANPFCWFGDLDYPFTDAVSEWYPVQFRRFYGINHQAVLAALDSLELSHLKHRVGLSVRTSKIHVHVPGLAVRAECAHAFLAVVKNIIESDPIKSELLALLGTDNLDKVFDGSVYSSGLRMLGSRKPTAKDKDPAWVTDKFYQVVDEDFEVDLTLDNDEDVFLDVLADCSIFNLAGDDVTRIAAPVAAVSSAPESLSWPPSQTEVEYMLKFLASALNGYNREEIFTIWTGTGRNGKGVLTDLVAAALGVTSGYFHAIRAALLTSDPPQANSPVPKILSLQGKRVIMGSEPEKGSSIRSGMLKLLTGNDRLSGRPLYSNKEISFEPQHTIILQTNAIPKLDATDRAIWKRCRISDFLNEFTDSPTRPNERAIDRQLKDEVKKWGPQFMLLLLEWYKVYLSEGLTPTAAMMAKSDETRTENDHFLRWFLERIVATPGKNVLNSSLFEDYLAWCHSAGERPLTRHSFGTRINTYSGFSGLTGKNVSVGDKRSTGIIDHSLVCWSIA
ncbi:hypothetical protein BJ741DRAFT_705046 [Chytriomyces cf. hyalinus JEL632]|nr:hypothetical protein BJ741DRAFT_705046 [Chytriomyces cf. hyalinus JEL632]